MMKEKKRNVIWTNDLCDCEERFLQSLKESYPEEDEDYCRSLVYEETERWFDDECMNLDIDLDSRIIIFAKLQLWNGAVDAYKELDGTNISDCLKASLGGSAETVTYYTEGDELIAEGYGHDNPCSPSVFRFRMAVPGKEDMVEKVLDAIYTKNPNAEKLIQKYTLPIGNKINRVYGW